MNRNMAMAITCARLANVFSALHTMAHDDNMEGMLIGFLELHEATFIIEAMADLVTTELGPELIAHAVETELDDLHDDEACPFTKAANRYTELIGWDDEAHDKLAEATRLIAMHAENLQN